MSGRTIENFTFAADEHGNIHFLCQEYYYTDGGGYYHENITYASGDVWDIQQYIEDEPETTGTKVPFLTREDLESAFTRPTPSMQEAFRIVGLSDTKVMSFIYVWVQSHRIGPCEAAITFITKEGATTCEHNPISEKLGDSADAVTKALLDKYCG